MERIGGWYYCVDASDDSEKESDNDNKQKSDEGKKSPEALALLLVRECKRADILLKTSPRGRTLRYETFRIPKGNDSSQSAGY